MNQEDIKEIAKIISNRRIMHKIAGNGLIDKDTFVKALADYFEKEMEEERKDWARRIPKTPLKEVYKKFNKQQFLKDCGVEEWELGKLLQ